MFEYDYESYNKKRPFKIKKSRPHKLELSLIDDSKIKKKKKSGRKSYRKIVKPNLELIISICGHSNLSRALGVSPGRLSNWLYTDVKVSRYYAKIMSELVLGIVNFKSINDNDADKENK